MQSNESVPGSTGRMLPGAERNASTRCGVWLLVLCILVMATAGRAEPPNGTTNGLPQGPITLADAINIALNMSPGVQRARKNVEASHGIAMQTRAIAIPKVGITGNYTAVEPSNVDKPEFPPGTGFEFDFGTDQNWRTQIRLVQSLYEGGRILSSLRAAKLTREQSMLSYQVAVADTVLDVQLAYYAVLLASQQISVQEASVELLTRELADTRRRFEAGTVPKFNVLRAEVELANAQPKLIRARNSYRISRNVLANVLGLTVPREALEDIPLELAGSLQADPWSIDLQDALARAWQNRKEIAALEKGQRLRTEELVSARAGYKPALEAFGGYDVHNSMFSSDLTDELHGWMAGVQLRWDIFDGLRTRGRVKQAQAQYDLSTIELDDTVRRIELEVRSAHSTFAEAGEVLQATEKVLEQAEEALRLARARGEAGTSTQLDVLSAQTALTDARNIRSQALHDYSAARARLERAVGLNVPASTP